MAKEGDQFEGKDGWREIRKDPEGGHLRPYPSEGPGGGSGCLGVVVLIVASVGVLSGAVYLLLV